MRNLSVRVGVLGAVVALGGFVACGSSSTKQVTLGTSSNPANVVIEMRDGSGNAVGSCSGVLVSSSTVLTAGHCVVAARQWTITTADGKQTASGAEVFTTWKDFDSSWSHPYHSDIGVILMDQPIFVAKYPTLAQSLTTDGTRLSRVRRSDAYSAKGGESFLEIDAPITLGQEVGFPTAYAVPGALAEDGTDTGGMLYDAEKNEIYGVVSGRGLTTQRIYVSRVDYLAQWINTISSCSPPPQTVQCHPSSSSGSSSGSTSSSSSSSSSSGSSSGGSSGCTGSSSSSSSSSSGSGSSSGGGSSNGGSTSSSGGWSSSGSGSGGSSGSSGGSSSGGGGGCNPPPPPPPPPPPGSDGGCSSGSSSGGMSSSGSSSGGHSSSGSGSGGNSSGSSSGSGSPPGGGVPLIPDGPGCTDALCGGCVDNPACGDNQQDYGGCGCSPTSGPGYEAGPIQ